MEESQNTYSTEMAQKTCIPCRGSTPRLSESEIERLQAHVTRWTIVDTHHLERTYTFSDFATALAFVGKLGEVAEQQGHHPDIHLCWGKVEVRIWTHKIDGLTESDFILAAKTDRLYPALQE